MMKKCMMMFAALFSLAAVAEEAHPLRVTVSTPHPGFGLRIERVDLKDNVHHILARVISPDPDMMFPMVIGEASDTVSVPAQPENLRVYLVNRTWNWGDEDVTALDSVEAYEEIVAGAEAVKFTREEAAPPRQGIRVEAPGLR